MKLNRGFLCILYINCTLWLRFVCCKTIARISFLIELKMKKEERRVVCAKVNVLVTQQTTKNQLLTVRKSKPDISLSCKLRNRFLQTLHTHKDTQLVFCKCNEKESNENEKKGTSEESSHHLGLPFKQIFALPLCQIYPL